MEKKFWNYTNSQEVVLPCRDLSRKLFEYCTQLIKALVYLFEPPKNFQKNTGFKESVELPFKVNKTL